MATDQTTPPSGTDSGTSSWSDPERHPLDDEPTRAVPVQRDGGGLGASAYDPAQDPAYDDTPGARRGRGLGANRHLSSIVLAFLATPAAYGFLDYAAPRAIAALNEDRAATLPQTVWISLLVGAGLFLVATLSARISALGPLVAGLVWGAGPLAWMLLDFPGFVNALDSIPEMYDNTSFGLYQMGFALFPATAGLLVGAALSGRWRRPKTV